MAQPDRSVTDPKTGRKKGSVALSGKDAPTPSAKLAKGSSSIGAPSASYDINRAKEAIEAQTDTLGIEEIIRAWKQIPEGALAQVEARPEVEERFRSYTVEQNIETIPNRIKRGAISTEKGKTPNPNLLVIEAGGDPRNRRLEVVIFDAQSGESTTHAYRNVFFQERDIQLNSDGTIESKYDIGSYWYSMVRGNANMAYHTQEASKLAGRAPNCLSCGQFADYAHACPSTIEPVILTPGDETGFWGNYKVIVPPNLDIDLDDGVSTSNTESEVSFDLPSASTLRNLIYNHQPVTINGLYARTESSHVTGSVTIYQNEDGELKFNVSRLVCSCEKSDPTCLHIDILLDGIKTRILSPIGNFAELSIDSVRRAQVKIDQEAKDKLTLAEQKNWLNNPVTYLEAQQTWIRNSPTLYSQDTEAFLQDYEEVSSQLGTNGKPVISYVKENALGGFAQRGSGQGFGLEIEYDLGNLDGKGRVGANNKIGIELYELGILPMASRENYHAYLDEADPEDLEFGESDSPGADPRVYNPRRDSDTQVNSKGEGNWTFENDNTVTGGELISPIMYDEPDSWNNIEKIIEVIKKHGGTVSTAVAGHVHVGTAFFNGDPSKYTELARLMTQHEDVLYRLASDPERGTHRRGRYNIAVPELAPIGFQSIRALKTKIGRGVLNYAYVAGDRRDHPEFRLFDGTLNPGAIQAHVKLAVAMTHAASRAAELGGTKRDKEPVGNHLFLAQKRAGDPEYARKSEKEKLLEETATLRSFLDTLFEHREDKKHILAIFASTQWSGEERG